MKKRQKEVHKIILLAISSFLLVHPILHEGHTVSETAIFHSAPVIEHQHWDSLFFGGRQENYQGPQNFPLFGSFPMPGQEDSVLPSSLMAFFTNQQSAILRC